VVYVEPPQSNGRVTEPATGADSLSRTEQLRAAVLNSYGLDDLPAPEALIDGILYRDTLAWLHGPEHAGANGWEAARSLGKFLGIPAIEARSLLASGAAGPEIRSRRADPAVARRLLERRFLPAHLRSP
jgi:hypothetical protein